MGSARCGECHGLQINGNQQQVWENSKHSKAYKILSSDKSTEYTKKNNLEAGVTNKICLRCHTTDSFLEGPPKLSSFNIDEGVGCETCHGAGSKYSANDVMKSGQLFREYGGSKSNETTCLKCHNLKGIHLSENYYQTYMT